MHVFFTVNLMKNGNLCYLHPQSYGCLRYQSDASHMKMYKRLAEALACMLPFVNQVIAL